MWTDATEWRFILRKEGIVTGSTTWTDLEDIMLNEISQVPKGGGCVISLTCGIKKSHLAVTENRMGGEGVRGPLVKQHKLEFMSRAQDMVPTSRRRPR